MKGRRLAWDGANWCLLLWAQFFGVILFGGFPGYYLARFQVWLLAMGLVLLLVLMAAAAVKHEAEDAEHEHEPSGAGRREFYFLHLLPLLLFMWIGPQPLGAQAMQGKSPFMTPPSGSRPAGPGLGQYEGYFPTSLLGLYSVPELSEGRIKVEVEGMIYHPRPQEVPQELRAEEVNTLLFHFVIVCCAADARPVSVVLEAERPLQYADETWVRVRGRASRIPGSTMLSLAAEEIEIIPAPSSPFISSR